MQLFTTTTAPRVYIQVCVCLGGGGLGLCGVHLKLIRGFEQGPFNQKYGILNNKNTHYNTWLSVLQYFNFVM